ncbi:MAG: response regulator [Deltaproteobacteria bacterium]|nr:response regulator [Deltaproteobacteria bacterium]
MNSWKAYSRFLEGMSITTRFGSGIALLLLLFVMISATSYLSMEFVGEAQKSIQTSTEIQRLVLEMDRGMEKARRLHGNFFLRYPEIGLKMAHEQYAQPAVRQIAQVISVSNTLKRLIDQSKVSAPLRKTQVDLNLFLSSAQRFADTSIQSVELVTELAAPEKGLEVQLEDHFTALQIETGNFENLARLCGEMKSFAQDYRISRKRFLMQSAFNSAFRLRKEIDNSPAVGAVQSQRINTLIDRCIATAHKILDVDVTIKANFNDFALQAEAVDAVSKTLAHLAREEVSQARTSIYHVRRLVLILMGGITLAGLIAALIIARMLNNRITQRVVNLTDSAEAFRKGNLDIFAREEGGDELSLLARTFNVMAARIRELIGNLELKVKARTDELSESERRFRQLFEHSSSGVVVYESFEDGKDFVFRDINKAVENIEGVNRSELIGKKVTEVFSGVAQFGLLDVFRQVWQTGQSARHAANYYSDGRVEGWRENAVYKLPSGEIVAVYDDLTAQKQADIERKAMEAKLQRAHKMESIGLLAGGVAHDLNNILSGIVGYPELLLMQMPKDSELRKPIQAIYESGQRAVSVVADLLTVARGVACAKEPASLNRLVKEYMVSPEYRKLKALHAYMDCITSLDPDLKSIHCSPVHVTKCIMNLVTNAMEAIEGPGRIVISTRNQHVDEKMALKNGINAGEYALLTVTDNGNGISEKDLEHIFEPFYTKKVMGISGTGLGLAVVWNSVLDHGGTVQVESTAGGTSFILYFPVSETETSPKETNAGIEGLKGSGETILVVDDEPLQRDIASRMLKVLGYDSVCVGSGEQAVAYLQQNRVDMILLDMLMDPGINGRQTYERILRIHPNQKAIIASGFSESEEVKMAQQSGARGFIKKPYSIEQLGRALKEGMGR